MKNTDRNNRIKFWAGVLLCLATIVSCTEWDDYKKYTRNGETIYAGNFQGGLVQSGKERVRLILLPTADPKVVKWKIFWNNNKDSAVFDFKTKKLPEYPDYNLVDTVFNVQEGIWSFKVFTYDAQGNSSVGINVLGTSYGAIYRRKIASQYRTIKSINYGTDETIVNWNAIDLTSGAIQTEISYKTVNNIDTVVVTPVTATTSVLKGFDPTTEFKYRTVFIPEATTIATDTFKTAYLIPVFVEQELDRSLFAQYPLPGDAIPNGNWDGVSVKKMWDGLSNSYDHSSFTDLGGDLTIPSIITFDAGVSAKMTKIWILPFRDRDWFEFTTIKRFEVWGSATPNPNGALDASWKLLASDTIKRPCTTCLVEDPSTAADIAVASAGFTFPLDLDQTGFKARYIRIRCLESFGRTGDDPRFVHMTTQSIGEIKVYGLLPKQ